jgi:uncharacterized protein (TIGR02001 family)
MRIFVIVICLLPLLVGSVALASAVTAKPFLDISGQVIVASEGVTKGISDSNGNSQIVGEVMAHRGRFYGELKIKNIKSADGADTSIQSLYGFRPKLGPYALNLFITHRYFDGTRKGVDKEFVEYQADISRRFGKNTLRLTHMYTPDSSGRTKAATWSGLGLSRQLSKHVVVTGNYALRRTKPARNYKAYNLGLVWALGQDLSLDIRYFDTDRHDYGKRFEDRAVIGLTRSF